MGSRRLLGQETGRVNPLHYLLSLHLLVLLLRITITTQYYSYMTITITTIITPASGRSVPQLQDTGSAKTAPADARASQAPPNPRRRAHARPVSLTSRSWRRATAGFPEVFRDVL